MPTVLVVGASRGLGLEWVKYYKKLGYDVIATTTSDPEDPNSAIELKKVLTDKDKILQLDVANAASVSSAMNQLAEAPDITIYNAGVKGYTKSPNVKSTLLNAELKLENDTYAREEGRRLAFEVNAHGFDRVMHALKDKLLAKPQATVVYISTGVAETSQNTSGGYPFYRQSKAAGESYAKEWDLDLRHAHSDLCKAQADRLALLQAQEGSLDSIEQETIIPPDSHPRVFSLVPGFVRTGMSLVGTTDEDLLSAADPAKRTEEMGDVVDYVKQTGDTFGVWKYDGTKQMKHEIPKGMKIYDVKIPDNVTETKEPLTPILAREGIYPVQKHVVDQSTQGVLLTKTFG